MWRPQLWPQCKLINNIAAIIINNNIVTIRIPDSYDKDDKFHLRKCHWQIQKRAKLMRCH